MPVASSTIHVEHGYDAGAYTYYPVVIIGAGETGIAMGCCLKKDLGFDQFRVFDRHAGAGGLYSVPGGSTDILELHVVRVLSMKLFADLWLIFSDVPWIFYSFSFAPKHDVSAFYPPGAEIVQYLHGVCQEYQITDKIQLNTDVSEVRWLETEKLWELTLVYLVPGTGDLSAKDRQKLVEENGEQSVYVKKEKIRAKVVLSAVGALVEPRGWPDNIPGKDSFEGEIFHSARWRHNVDFKDKDVVVMGTGCSAAQFVPELMKEPYNAKSVTQIMRSPPWVVPRPPPPGGDEAYMKYSPKLFSKLPGLAKMLRFSVFFGAEMDFQRIFFNTEKSQKGRKEDEEALLKWMRKTVPEKYHEVLTPNYGLGCKRRIYDAGWFKSMNNPKYRLTTKPLTSVQTKSVTIGPGRVYPDPKATSRTVDMEKEEVPADIIILGNGFDVTTWLHPLNVYGKGGRTMQEVWKERGGPQVRLPLILESAIFIDIVSQAYMGTALDGFPNFFILFGPNTATGHTSVILASENMVNYAMKFVKPIIQGEVDVVDVKKDAEIAWTSDIQSQLKDTVWMSGGCLSWYYDQQGWNSTVYPRSQFDYIFRCMFPKWTDWNVTYTNKGVLKNRLRKGLEYAGLAATIVLAYQLIKEGRSIIDFTRSLVRSGASLIQRGALYVQQHV
ncbi:MAG: hypothetical protein MMC33_004475 [Icmadophila ericetorum]|nr:hypothetical protein [Icmadophila ericetorum]